MDPKQRVRFEELKKQNQMKAKEKDLLRNVLYQEFAYENMFFKGQDKITIFDHYLTETVSLIEGVYESLVGEFRLYDLGGDTDCYIDFKMRSSGKLIVSGRLGSTFSSNSLTFEFDADQTLLKPLLRSLTVN